MTIIDSKYEVRKTETANFFGGTLPNWLNDASTGAGSVTAQSAYGGRARLSTGTTATGDTAVLESNDLWPGINFDAIYVSAIYTTTFDTDQDSTQTMDPVGLENSDASDYIYHRVWDGGGGDDDTLKHKNAGGTATTNTRVANKVADTLIQSEILWDGTDDVVYHRMQDTFAVKLTSTIPEDDTYRTRHYIETHDTSSDRKFDIYEISISYLRQK